MGKAKTKQGAGNGVGSTTTMRQEVRQTIDVLTLSVPLAAEKPGEYAGRHIDIHLSDARAVTLKRFTDGLIAHGAILDDERKVTSGADAVRWLLDGMLAALEASAAVVGSEN